MKNKFLWFAVVLIIILPIAWYLISPIFRVIEVQEESPLESSVDIEEGLQVKDSMGTMGAATKAEFEKQVNSMKDQITEMDDTMPSAPKLIAEGIFKPRAHEVQGKALLIDDGNKQILRFEDFETINGPELHIYLSSEFGDEHFIDLGKIKATKGSVNYDIPLGLDTSKYNKVLVWCKPFSVLFSYAELV